MQLISEKYEKNYVRQEKRIISEIAEKEIVQTEKLSLLKSLVPTTFYNKRILDVGGGAGALAVQIAAETLVYVTLDISRTALKLAELYCEKMGVTEKTLFVLADAHYLPFKTGSMDVVILTDVIEHVTKPQTVLMETYTVLSTNGFVYVTVPFLFGLETIFMDDLLRIAYSLKLKKELPTHLASYSESQLRGLLESTGFSPVNCQFYSASFFLTLLNNRLPIAIKGSLEKTIFKLSCLAMCGQVKK